MTPRAFLVALVAGALLSACAPNGAETPSPTPETPATTATASPSSTTSASPTPSPSSSPTTIESFPPPPDDETEEEAAIREGWMNYLLVLDSLVKNPFVNDFTDTQRVTVPGSEESKVILDTVEELRANNWRVAGDQVFRDYSASTPKTMGDVRSVEVTYCYDGRSKYLVDNDSGQRVDIQGPDTLEETILLEQGQDGLWRVATVRNEATAC